MKKNIECTPEYISDLLTRFINLREEVEEFMHKYNTIKNEFILDRFDNIKVVLKSDVIDYLYEILGDVYYRTNNKPKE